MRASVTAGHFGAPTVRLRLAYRRSDTLCGVRRAPSGSSRFTGVRWSSTSLAPLSSYLAGGRSRSAARGPDPCWHYCWTNANAVVSADRLVNELWPELTRERAAANLQVRLSELRKALRSVGEADRLCTRAPGYLLRVAADELDAVQFQRRAASGREALGNDDAASAVRLLDQALALWRGPALADLEDAQFASREQARLEEERLAALESRVDAQLACGRHQETVAELEALTSTHPLRERFWAQRLLALYRAGRQADALRVYRELRSTLVDQLGIEPGPELRELHARILRHDAQLKYRPASSKSDGRAQPQTHYVESGGVHIAYQVLGAGERDILFVPGLMSHLELAWEDPETSEFYSRPGAWDG